MRTDIACMRGGRRSGRRVPQLALMSRVAAWCLCGLIALAVAAAAQGKPNIVILFVDGELQLVAKYAEHCVHDARTHHAR